MRELCCVDALGVGMHHAREGVMPASMASLQMLVSKFRQMKAKRIAIPMFWGHQMKRGGPVHSDDKATQRALWTAGWVHDVEMNPSDSSRLRVIFPPPPGMSVDEDSGALVDPVKHTQIKEVSLGIGDWKDGTGEWWEDVIVHVALTPLPVWLGQNGISMYDSCEKLIALSSDSEVRVKYILGGTEMPASFMKKGGAPSEMEDDDEEGNVPPMAEGESEEVPNEQAEEPDGDEDGANPMDQLVDEGPEEMGSQQPSPEATTELPLIEQLGELGIALPEDTTALNFVDRMSGVVAGLLAAGAKIVTGGEKELGPVAAMKDATPESPPLFTLSTGDASIKNLSPLEQALASRMVEEARQKRRQRCTRLEEGGVPKRLVDIVRSRGTQVNLSLDGGSIQESMPDVDGYLDLLEVVAEEIAPLMKATLSTSDAIPAGSPIASTMPRREYEQRKGSREEEDKRIEELVKKVFGPEAKANL